MKNYSFLLLLMVSLTANAKFPRAKLPYKGFNPNVMPWPLPQQIQTETTYLNIDPKNLTIVTSMSNCSIVNQAIKKYEGLLFQQECLLPNRYSSYRYSFGAKGFLTKLTVMVMGPCENKPSWDMDEMYLLKIDTLDQPGEATLVSTSEWGALRGLESFSQIVYDVGNGLFAVNSTMILDFPRFSYRGFLLDTSRHFLSIRSIKEHLELMAMNKYNVFHWHIVDDQSFPYESKTFPDLSEKGAYKPGTHVYSQADIADIIDYARQLGIRVVAEFDTPGHTLSWGKGNPELLTPCYSKNGPDGTYGPIDPSKNSTYSFLRDLFAEVTGVFPDQYVHLGGDEVSFNCWKSNPNISEFMANIGIDGDYAKLEEYYIQKILGIVQSLKKSYIVWQEVIDNKVEVADDTVIHVWKNPYPQEMSKVTSMGHQAILSSCWYLSTISYGADWKAYYGCEPYAFNGTDAQKKLVMGGEACMWGEWVDGANLISRNWPRGSAVAERLWSSQNVTDVTSATKRIERLRCLMIKRGYTVEPINGPGYCPCDHVI